MINPDNHYYLILEKSLAFEKIMYQVYIALNDDQKANESYKRVLRKESTLSLIRTNRLSSQPIY